MKPYFIHFNIEPFALPHIDPLMGGAQQCPPDFTFGPVMRQYYIIEYVLRGKGEYTVNGEVYPVTAGQAFVIKPYEVHILRADSEEPWEYVWLGFTTDLQLPTQLAENYVIDAACLRDIFLRLTEKDGAKLGKAAYAAMVYAMFTRLYVSEQKEEIPQSSMEQAVAIIRKEYATITVQDLADRLFLNRSYFGTQFKKHTGKSPKEYIDECRMASATKLMHELGYTVTQAAAAVGYSDVMSFSKMFKRRYGRSPREFVKFKSSEKKRATFFLK